MLTGPLFYVLSLLAVVNYNPLELTSGDLLAYMSTFSISYLMQSYLTIPHVEITMCPAPV